MFHTSSALTFTSQCLALSTHNYFPLRLCHIWKPSGQLNIDKVHLTQFSQSQVLDCERRANKSPEKLVVALLSLLFTSLPMVTVQNLYGRTYYNSIQSAFGQSNIRNYQYAHMFLFSTQFTLTSNFH